ncbi:MAG: glycosyltransferase [Candidatus Woesearchaeota archaeon]
MKFSVLISVYNKEKPEYLDLCLNSVIKNQTLKPTQIVLVEDGILTSELYNVINKWKKHLTIHKLKKNQGLGISLRNGLEKCKYNYIARMDSDDICHKNRFQKQINFLEKNKKIDILGTSIKEFDNIPNDLKFIRKVPKNHKKIIEFCKYRSPFNHMTVIFNKEIIKKAGNYNNKFPFLEDYYLWYRTIKKGAITANLQEPLVYARTNNMHQKRKGIKYLRNEIRLKKEMYKNNFINIFELSINIFARILIRLLPTTYIKKIYITFLRNK